jgi:hypothetical protein
MDLHPIESSVNGVSGRLRKIRDILLDFVLSQSSGQRSLRFYRHGATGDQVIFHVGE